MSVHSASFSEQFYGIVWSGPAPIKGMRKVPAVAAAMATGMNDRGFHSNSLHRHREEHEREPGWLQGLA